MCSVLFFYVRQLPSRSTRQNSEGCYSHWNANIAFRYAYVWDISSIFSCGWHTCAWQMHPIFSCSKKFFVRWHDTQTSLELWYGFQQTVIGIVLRLPMYRCWSFCFMDISSQWVRQCRVDSTVGFLERDNYRILLSVFCLRWRYIPRVVCIYASQFLPSHGSVPSTDASHPCIVSFAPGWLLEEC